MEIRTVLVGIMLSLAVGFYLMPDNSQASSQDVERYTGPIIDMHIHAFDDSNPLMGITHPPTLRGETYKGSATAEELKKGSFDQFRKYRIVKAVVTDGRLWWEEAQNTILIADADKSPEALRAQHEAGQLQAIAEMAPFYGGIRADHPSQQPYFELAEGLGIPVGFHILPGGPNYGIHVMPEMMAKTRTINAYPSQIEEVLVKHPKLKLYIMHGGWPHTDEVKALMYAHPNLYVDIAVLNWLLPEEELFTYLKSLINAGFGNRIMYGTDQMVWPQLIGVGIETVNAADFLSLQQKEDIFYDNAAEFLGLDADEIEKHKQQSTQ